MTLAVRLQHQVFGPVTLSRKCKTGTGTTSSLRRIGVTLKISGILRLRCELWNLAKSPNQGVETMSAIGRNIGILKGKKTDN